MIVERQILHVDVNNAFLSWSAIERLKNGDEVDIRTIPSAICGDENKRSGIILAKSPLAKSMGIVTGETVYQAMKKCPSLKLYSSDFKAYRKHSDALYNLLLEYTDKIERFSIDECFLDMTEFLMGDTLLYKAQEINRRVKNELGFTVNIGLSTNKLLAKMASDFSKPDKIHTLYPNEIKTKMWGMDVSELFMIGKKTAPKLNKMGIYKIGDLACYEQNTLIRRLGKFGKLAWEYANGIDNSEVVYTTEKAKSIGNSVTLPMDVTSSEKLESVLLALVEQVTYRLRKENMMAASACVQLRTKDFKDFSHQAKLDFLTDNTSDIYAKAKMILKDMYVEGMPIRLIGFRVDKLKESEEQISFFDTDKKEKNKLDETIDQIKNKYGYTSIKRAGEMDFNKMFKKF